MPVIDLDMLPPDVLADLRREAEANGRTVVAEVAEQIVTRVRVRRGAEPELPVDKSDRNTDDELTTANPVVEFTARGQGVRVQPIDRDQPPPLGEPIPSPEMIAPYDLPVEGSAERVKVRDAGPYQLECWYGEDKLGD